MTKENWKEVITYGAYTQELDWYAIDKKGNIGMFSAIMDAPIPSNIKESYENYIGLRHLIKSLQKSTLSILTTAEQGNRSDWISYAEKGLFAFDFQDAHRSTVKNQYDLIARPVQPLNIRDINIPTNLLDTLARLDCDFSQGDIKTELIK